jgi:hypothetical protein
MMMYNRHVCADGEAIFQKLLASELLKESLSRRVKKKEKKKKKKRTNILVFPGLQDCNLQSFDLSCIVFFVCCEILESYVLELLSICC